MCDIWRVQNPETRRYTWRKNIYTGIQQSRIDYWIVPNSYMYRTTDINIEPGVYSDHSIIGEEFGEKKTDSPYTWVLDPIDGTFSPEQKSIYELVLKAQQAGIEATRAGQSFGAPHMAAQRIITEGLLELGLIQEEKEVRTFFMHGTSHYLGLYVHDVGTGESLTPGTVITVEPGIYISPSPEIDPKWWNIGVRIEDDVLVTRDDPVVMSNAAPRTVEDIEALMKQTGLGNDPVGVVERDAKTDEPARGSQ